MSPTLRDDIKIIRRPIKHARLRVRENTSVELVVPEDFVDNEIDAILRKKETWIQRHRAFFRSHPRRAINFAKDKLLLFGQLFRILTDPLLSCDMIIDEDEQLIWSRDDLANVGVREKWYRRFARNYLSARIHQLAKKHRFLYRRLFVRSQRTRWGSCTAKGNVCLNWRLVMAPKYVIDYVILHELMHTCVMNHTQRFWVQLRAMCPDHSKATNWLRHNSPPSTADFDLPAHANRELSAR
jgi:predicted metal-dependent hydrolase